jgi:hypothetical protein
MDEPRMKKCCMMVIILPALTERGLVSNTHVSLDFFVAGTMMP